MTREHLSNIYEDLLPYLRQCMGQIQSRTALAYAIERQVNNEATHSSCYSTCDDDCHHCLYYFFCLFCSPRHAVYCPTYCAAAYSNSYTFTDSNSSSPNSHTDASPFH